MKDNEEECIDLFDWIDEKDQKLVGVRKYQIKNEWISLDFDWISKMTYRR